MAGRGSHFDPRVVDSFVALAAERGVVLPDEPGEADEAWNAAQTCHDIVPDREPVLVG